MFLLLYNVICIVSLSVIIVTFVLIDRIVDMQEQGSNKLGLAHFVRYSNLLQLFFVFI